LIFEVGNLFIIVVEGHDSSGSKLPLLPVLQGNIPTKDVANASIGILIGMTRVLVAFFFGLVLLIRPLVVLTVIFLTIFVTAALPFAGVRVVDGLQAPEIPYCMAGVWMGWARTLKDLGVGILVVALRRWLDSIDGVVS
jgi:hypothetical protein